MLTRDDVKTIEAVCEAPLGAMEGSGLVSWPHYTIDLDGSRKLRQALGRAKDAALALQTSRGVLEKLCDIFENDIQHTGDRILLREAYETACEVLQREPARDA